MAAGAAGGLLVLDNGSAFTPEIAGALEGAGARFELAPAGGMGLREAGRYGSYVLSGRRRNDRRMNALNAGIVRHAASSGKPLLGICYGAEMVALASGGALRRMPAPRRGPAEVLVGAPNPLCAGRLRVFESHAFEVARLGGLLEPLGGSAECANELVRVRGTGVFGAQFHPEMTPDGRRMIGRFAAL